jgi:glycosyltransferase involved in cell wall biosynthesis
MTTWLFIGPRLLAGIGQVTKRYATLTGGDFVEMGQRPPKEQYDTGFAFVLPFEDQLNLVDQYKIFCKKMIYMTICETETVHPLYGMLVDRYKTLYVASEFCQKVFQRQFPQGDWRILHLHAPPAPERTPQSTIAPYTFYTIGNVNDPRKNIKALIQALDHCPGARLLIKATCLQEVKIDHPQVTVINGLISDEQMENIHKHGHCYVNCSHSEGVGMGAVEAAQRGKPVIITDYGGLKEYVKTPFEVTCDLGPIGFDDFLFTKDLVWGHPRFDDLVKHMKHCYENRITRWEHPHTSGLMDSVTDELSGASQ